MSRLLRIVGQAIVTAAWAVVTFVQELGAAEMEVFDGGKSDREFLRKLAEFDKKNEELREVLSPEAYQEYIQKYRAILRDGI